MVQFGSKTSVSSHTGQEKQSENLSMNRENWAEVFRAVTGSKVCKEIKRVVGSFKFTVA